MSAPSKNAKSEINDWCIFATQSTQKATYISESDNAKPPSYRCTLTLPDGRTFQSQGWHKKKKDAEQEAAGIAMLAIGRSKPEPSIAEPTSDTAAGRWQLVKHRLEAAFSDKNVVHFSPLYPFFVESKLTNRPIPLTAIAQLDNRLAAALRGVDPRAEWDPLCGLALLVAAVHECQGVQLTDDGLAVKRRQPWPEDLNRAPPPHSKPSSPPPGSSGCFAAVFLPQNNNRSPVKFHLPRQLGHMRRIAAVLGISSGRDVGGCESHRVLVSRPVAKAGSNLRIYSELPPLPTAHVSNDGSVTFVPAASGEQTPPVEADSSNPLITGKTRERKGELFEERGAALRSGERERHGTAGTEQSERKRQGERSGTGTPVELNREIGLGESEETKRNEGSGRAEEGNGTPGHLNERNGTKGTERGGTDQRNAGAPERRNGLNEGASWVAGYAVYGDAIMASVGTTYSSQGRLTWDDVSTKDWHTLLSSRHPRGMYQLSRGAPLAATLPHIYPGSDRWEGKTPKTLLYELVKHKCSGAEGKEPVYTLSENGRTAGGGAGMKDAGMEEVIGVNSPCKEHSPPGLSSDEDRSRKVVGREQPGEDEAAGGKRPKLDSQAKPAVQNHVATSPEEDSRSETTWRAEVGYLFEHRWMKASSQGVWASPRDAENSAALVGLQAVQALFDSRVLTREAAEEEASLGAASESEHEGIAIIDYTMLYEVSAEEREEVVKINQGVLRPMDVGAVGWAGESETNRGESPSLKDAEATSVGVSGKNQGSLEPMETEPSVTDENEAISGESNLGTNREPINTEGTGPTAVGIVLEDNRGFSVPRGTGALLPQLETCIDSCPQGETRTVRLRPLSSWRPISAPAWEDSPENHSLGLEEIAEAERKEVKTLGDVIVHVRVSGYVEPREQRLEGALFKPSLATQRMDFALGVINRCKAASVLDLGCGSGAFLEAVVGKATCVTKLAGVDISERALQKARKAVRARVEKRAVESGENDRGMLASTDEVQILSGSMLTLDNAFIGWDLATCIEVVEHLDPGPLADFGPTVLGRLRPRALLVSTPNVEYNPILQAAATGKCASDRSKEENEGGGVSARLRNDDHRFEWTRAEFEAWAKGLATRYGYSVVFGGVGSNGTGTEPGFCTQIALFQKADSP